MGNLIAIVVIVLILGSSIGYIIKAKKSGVHCIGCPTGASCSGHCESERVEVVESSSEGLCGCTTGEGCTCSDGDCNCH